MVKKVCALALCLSALSFSVSNVSHASDTTQKSFLQRIKHEVNLGPDVSYITYREPGVMKERGWFYGIAADAYLKYPLNKCWNLATGLEVKYAWSRVDYSSDESGLGAKYATSRVDYSSDESGDMDGIKDRLFEVRLLLGAEWFPYKNISFMPYVGFGYRKLTDDSSGKETDLGALGYKRTIRYFYVPIGISGAYYINPNWKIKGYAEYDYFIRGKVKSYLSDIDPTLYEDIKNTQDNGYGIRAGVSIVRNFKSFELSGGPYVKYWKIDKSDISYDSWGREWVEPKNHSTETGAMLRISF